MPPHLPTVPRAFLNQAPQNILTAIEIGPLVLDMQCWYSNLMLFREKDIYYLESCIGGTVNRGYFAQKSYIFLNNS